MKINDGSIMVRPTLIVGLGGTGVLVCQWAEEFIRNLFDGRVPPFIRFLKLDTDALEEGGPADASLSDFYNLFQNLDIGAVVRDCAKYPELHPHLDWFTALRGRLDAVFADYGCQGIPRLGRLVFTEQRENVIHPAVSARFGSLRAATQQDLKDEMGQFVLAADAAPAVHVAASVCGGTGAGMLIDMAYNLRWWSRESFRRPAEIIGHLMLPEAFVINPVLRPKLQAVAAATLEQIEFLSDPRRDDIPVHYPGSSGKRSFDRLTAPFNFLYLLNGQGDLGVGNRKHLVKMIARAIRAMVLEPTSKLVASESNNKLVDALGLYDPATGRRQCFASYGLWQGTPGQDHGDVLSWVGTRLHEMRDVDAGRNRQVVEKMRQTIEPFLSVAGKVEGIGSCSFEYTRNAPTIAVQDIEDATRTFFKEKVEPSLRSRCEEIIKPQEHHAKLLQSVVEAVEEYVLEERLGCVPAALDECIQDLQVWRQNRGSAKRPSYEGVREQIQQKIKPALEASAKEKHRTSVTGLKPEEAVKVVQSLVDSHWNRLALACLHETLEPSISRALGVLRLWRQTVESLTILASDSSFSRKVAAGLNGETYQNNSGELRRALQENDVGIGLAHFSTALNVREDPTPDPTTPLGSKFRQDLIRPILRQVVFSAKDPKEAEEGITGTEKRLLDAIHQLEAARQQFLEAVRIDKQGKFYSRVSADMQADKHDYFIPVNKIYERAAPKIDLNRANKYAQPLPVTISQHTKGCCVPDLLGHSLGADFREAHVSEEFERKTDVWFQLLRINYGFCLEALATYGDYQTAARKYIHERTRFEDSNMWLDDRWYGAYQLTKEQWKDMQAQLRQADRRSGPDYEETARRLATIQKGTHTFFTCLLQGLSRCQDVSKAVEAMRVCTQTEDRVSSVLDRLTPSDGQAIHEGSRVCRQMIDSDILAPSSSVLEALSPEDREELRGTWNVFTQGLGDPAAQALSKGSGQPMPS